MSVLWKSKFCTPNPLDKDHHHWYSTSKYVSKFQSVDFRTYLYIVLDFHFSLYDHLFSAAWPQLLVFKVELFILDNQLVNYLIWRASFGKNDPLAQWACEILTRIALDPLVPNLMADESQLSRFPSVGCCTIRLSDDKLAKEFQHQRGWFRN